MLLIYLYIYVCVRVCVCVSCLANGIICGIPHLRTFHHRGSFPYDAIKMRQKTHIYNSHAGRILYVNSRKIELRLHL